MLKVIFGLVIIAYIVISFIVICYNDDFSYDYDINRIITYCEEMDATDSSCKNGAENE